MLGFPEGFAVALWTPSQPLRMEMNFFDRFRRGLCGRPLHPFGRILLEGVNEWRVMIFPCNTQSLACKATAEGFQGAIGKPLGINIPKQDG